MIDDTTPCSVENTEEDDILDKKQHKKYDVCLLYTSDAADE